MLAAGFAITSSFGSRTGALRAASRLRHLGFAHGAFAIFHALCICAGFHRSLLTFGFTIAGGFVTIARIGRGRCEEKTQCQEKE